MTTPAELIAAADRALDTHNQSSVVKVKLESSILYCCRQLVAGQSIRSRHIRTEWRTVGTCPDGNPIGFSVKCSAKIAAAMLEHAGPKAEIMQ